MTLREIAALMRRHLLAVTVVLLIAVAVGYDFGNTPPAYSESATVVFTAKNSPAGSRSNPSFIVPLIATEVMMAQTLTSPPGQSQVRAAGGTASFQLVPSNLYSLQYPNYDEPDATLTATSQRPADAHRTFMVVLRLLGQRLTAMQAQAHVPLRGRIREYLVGDTGLASQPASATRVLAGLALLTLVGVFMVASFLDRRQRRPGILRAAGRRRRLAA
jgi:hypothetical protein